MIGWVLALSFIGTSPAGGPATPRSDLRVVHSEQISADEPRARHVESVLAVDPQDSRKRIAAAIVLEVGERVAVYASKDSGRTWTRATWGPEGRTDFDGLDPAVAFASDGSAYVLAMGTELQVWKSTDGGFHWGNPVVVPGRAWDRPWVACAPGTPGAPAGRIFVAGKMPVTVFGHVASDILAVSVSDDGGAKFPFPRLFLPDPDADLLNVSSDLVLDVSGNAVLALQLFSPDRLDDGILQGTYATALLRDGGRSVTPPRPGPSFRTFGHSWEGKSHYGFGGARLAVDASGETQNGRLYFVWLDASDGFHRVMASSSSDAGGTWSDPVLVSDPATDTDASTPAIAVDGKGNVAVVWYDRRSDPGNGCYQLYAAVSRDGAASFSRSQPLDPALSCPLASGAGVAGPPAADLDAVSSEYRFKNGGDTQGLVGLPGGGFQAAWIRAGADELQLWSTAFAADGSLEKP